jgi:uncharacterized protein (TIGR00369 family)
MRSPQSSDSACGYAALSAMSEGSAVLTVEFKINLLNPAAGSRSRATGKVLRSGKTLTVCTGAVEANDENKMVSHRHHASDNDRAYPPR